MYAFCVRGRSEYIKMRDFLFLSKKMLGKPWTGDGLRISMAYFLHFIYSYWVSTGGTIYSPTESWRKYGG